MNGSLPQLSWISAVTNSPTNALTGGELVPLVVPNQVAEKVTVAQLTAYIFLQSATAIASLPVAATPLAGTELVEVVQGGVAKVTTIASLTQQDFGVVGQLTRLNLAANLAPVTIYTPAVKVMCRLTFYMLTTVVDAGAGTLQPTYTYRDDNAAQTQTLSTTAEGTLDLTTVGHNQQVAQAVFEAIAGTPITLALAATGAFGTARANVYAVLEAFAL